MNSKGLLTISLTLFAGLLAFATVSPAQTILNWGGGTVDISDNTAVPANLTAGDWSAGGVSPKNWATSATSPNAYSVWTNGSNIANLGTMSSGNPTLITVLTDLEAGGLILNQTSAAVTKVNLTSVSARTLTFGGTNPTLNLSSARVDGQGYLGVAGALQLVATNGTLTVQGSGFLGFAGTALHDINTLNLLGSEVASGPLTSSGGLTLATGSVNSIKDTATINASGRAQIVAQRSETIGTLNMSDESIQITTSAINAVFQMGSFDRGNVGTVSFTGLETSGARVRITGSGEPTNNVTLPWAVNGLGSTNAAFVKYDSVTDSFSRVTNTVATVRDLTDASWGTYNSTQDVAYFLSSAATTNFTGQLAGNLSVNTLLLTSTAASQGMSDFNLGGNILTTKALALAGAGGSGSHIGITNGFVLAPSTEAVLYLHGNGIRDFTAVIGKSGEADTTFDVVLRGTSSQQYTAVNQYIGTMYIDGGAQFNRTAGSGEVVTGNLVLRPGADVILSKNEQINDASVVTVALGARIGNLADIAFSETIKGLEGSGTVRLGVSGNNNKNLTISTAGGNYTFSGNITGFDGNTGSAVTKAGLGTQTFAGTNTYNQTTLVSGGTLQFAKQVSLYGNDTAKWTSANITVESGATAAFNVGGTGEFTTGNVTTLLTNLGGLGGAVNNNGLKAGSAIAFDTTNASGGTFTVADNIANSTGTGGGAIGVTKLGTNALVLTGNNSYTGATTVSGGSLQVGNGGTTGSIANSANISVATGATLKTNRSDSMTLGQAITGAGNVENANTSTGSTILGSNSNAYTGTTTVSGGSLQVGSSGTGKTGTGAVSVQNGSTILGTGVVQGSSFTAASGSTVQAGDSTAQNNYGTLTFTPVSGSGSFDFQSGSTVVLGINPGGTSDQLKFTGADMTLSFNGNLTVGPASFTPAQAEVFQLLDWSGLTGTPIFSFDSRFTYTGLLTGNGDEATGLNLSNISGSGFLWDISQFTINGSIAIVVVPEPSRALLLMLGLVGLMTRRRGSRSLSSLPL